MLIAPHYSADSELPCGNTFDIAIIGAGLSGTFLLKHIIENLSDRIVGRVIQILLIDRSGFFGKGIAYGPASGTGTLLNHKFSDFLPSHEVSLFRDWICKNKEKIRQLLRANNNPAALDWERKFGDDLESDRILELHLPRCIYGEYFHALLTESVRRAVVNKVLSVQYLWQGVTDMYSHTDRSELLFSDSNMNAYAKDIVICNGPIYRDQHDPGANNFISNLYSPTIDSNFEKIDKLIIERANQYGSSELVILGWGASGHELVYLLSHRPDLLKKLKHIKIFTPHGSILREPQTLGLQDKEYISNFTGQTFCQSCYNTADDLFKGLNTLLDALVGKGYSGYSLAAFIKPALNKLLITLPSDQINFFLSHYSAMVERYLRRTNSAYSMVAQRLEREGVLSIVSATIGSIRRDGVNHMIEAEGSTVEILGPNCIIVDSRGLSRLATDKQSLIGSLIHRGVMSLNASQLGVAVNDNLQSIPGTYVLGPLLSGMVCNDGIYWNTSGAQSLYGMSRKLAKHVVSTL